MPEISAERIRVMHVQDKCGHGGAQIQGVQRLLLWWLPAFSNTEFDLSLCILRNRNAASKSFDDAGIPVTYLNRGRFDPRTTTDLIKLVKEHNIQILHCHGYGATTFGRLVRIFCKVQVIVHEHMIDESIPFYQKIIDRILAPLTSRAIAVSSAVGDFMMGPRAIPKEKLVVIYNGLPAEYCHEYTKEEKAVIAKELDIAMDVPLLGIVGRLHPVKGHADFLMAASNVLRVFPDACFLVVGDGDLRTALEQRAVELGIKDQVIFLGHREDIKEILAILDILVISSYSEGCPLTLLEGMAAGKAIVSTTVGGIPEMLRNRHTALLIGAGDTKAMSSALETLIKNKDLRGKLGAQAKITCENNYLITHTVWNFSELYKLVLMNR